MARRISRERADTIVRQFHKYADDYEAKGVSRRQFLKLIAAGSAATTVLPVLVGAGAVSAADAAQARAAAGGASLARTLAQQSASTPKKGGTIIIGTLGEAQSINPLLINETEGTWRCKMMYEEFIELDPVTLKPRPNIAKEWSISDDHKTYTFTLQDGVTFSDGTPLTANDIEFTLYGLLTKSVASPQVTPYLTIEGAQDFYNGKATKISGVQVVDEKTIKITTAQPYAAFVTQLESLRPLPKHLLNGKNLANDKFFQSPVGAGPFQFKSWSHNQDFVATRNPHYWEEGKPYLDSFTHRVIADSQTLVIALQTGQIEASLYAQPTQANDLKKKSDLKVLVAPPGIDINGWNFGEKNNEQLKDPRVRRAIAMSLRVDQYVSDFLLGMGRVATSPIPATNWSYDKSLKPMPYDPAGAKKLLDEAGVKDLTLKAMVNAGNNLREDWLTFTQQSLSQVGIKVQPDIREWVQVVDAGTKGTFEMICPTFASVVVDPDELYTSLHTGEPQNVSNYSNPKMDQLLEQGRVEFDETKRKQIYAQIQQIIQQDVPVFYAWDRPFIHVITTPFEGYQDSILFGGIFQELENTWKSS